MDELDPASVQTSLQLRGLSWMEAERVLVLLPEGRTILTIMQHQGEQTLRYAFQIESVSVAEGAHILNGLQEFLETPPGERESAELRSWISPDPIREER